MAWHSPFDLYYWFVNVFAGDLTVFFAIAFLVIAALAGMFRMPSSVTGISFALFITLMAVHVGSIFLLIVVIIAILLALTLARLFR